MITIGIDPGVSGAAVLMDSKPVDFVDWAVPTIIVISKLRAWSLIYGPINLVALEQVGRRPGESAQSSNKFLANYGWWQGCLDTLRLPWIHVPPLKWQKGLLPKKTGPNDKPGLGVAARMFPEFGAEYLKRKKDNGRADAALIAWWARNYLLKGG